MTRVSRPAHSQKLLEDAYKDSQNYIKQFRNDLQGIGHPSIIQDLQDSSCPLLGPKLRPRHCSRLDRYFSDDNYGLPLFLHKQVDWESVLGRFTPTSFLRYWPSTQLLPTLNNWRTRLLKRKPAFRDQWCRMGIDHMISSTLQIAPASPSMLAAATLFWSDSLNVFLFARGPMTITLLDVVALTGAPIVGEVPSAYYCYHHDSTHLHLKSKSPLHVAELFEKQTTLDEDTDMFLFLWTWTTCFILPASGKMSLTALGLTTALVEGRRVALAQILLSSCYRSLHHARHFFLASKGSSLLGPWWIIQWWIQTYFTGVSPDRLRFPIGCHIGPPSISTTAFYIEEFLLASPTDSFSWFPYESVKRLPQWIIDRKVDSSLADPWKIICTTTDLPYNLPNPIEYSGDGSLRTSWKVHPSGCEVYHPQFAARQLGLAQGIPCPFSSAFNATRGGIRTDFSTIKDAIRNHFIVGCYISSETFPAQLLELTSFIITDGFGTWWTSVSKIFDDVRHRLAAIDQSSGFLLYTSSISCFVLLTH